MSHLGPPARATYIDSVGSLRVGKRLPEAVYVHTSLLSQLDTPLRESVACAVAIAGIREERFDVAKLGTNSHRVSLLAYPCFLDEPFPRLHMSWSVDLERHSVVVRSYRQDATTPILHRKELLLAPGHARIAEFEAITRELEREGLFDSVSDIGVAGRWEALLFEAGYRVQDHAVVRTDPDRRVRNDAIVLRHRTAIERNSFSSPMQALARHGFLDRRYSLFDYGCGRGGDLRGLQSIGVDCSGWDPHFAPERERKPADIVNLGFVLNVIENLAERREALLGAYSLARKLLIVSVLIEGRSAYDRHRLFRDGVLTSRGTFQKYFSQEELRQYLEGHLGREPISIAPGICAVFKDDEEEQRFLVARQTHRHSARAQVTTSPRQPRVRPPRAERAPRVRAERQPSKWEIHAPLLEAYWEACLRLGRPPEPDEFERMSDLKSTLGHPGTVLRRLLRERQPVFHDARRARTDDLSVYFAVNVFERRRSFRSLPETVQRDVRTFWGSYTNAQAAAMQLLYSVGDVEAIHAACVGSAASGLGCIDDQGGYFFHASLLKQLPANLRTYVGCAARIYGDVDGADLIKIHSRTGKLSIMVYDDFEGRAIPDLIERIKINLRTQETRFFQYGDEFAPQPLYLKSRYLHDGFPHRVEQLQFDEELKATGLFDFTGFGPPGEEFYQKLRSAGLAVQDFALNRSG